MRGDINQIIRLLGQDNTSLDLSELRFVLPVFVLSIVCLYKKQLVSIVGEASDISIDNYLNRVGFYNCVNMHSYSIRNYDTDNLMEICPIDAQLSDSKIEELRDKLLHSMGITVSTETEAKAYSVNFFLAELIRNVTNHACLDSVNGSAYFMFQAYRAKGCVNIAIVDTGIGIKQSFQQGGYYNQDLEIKDYIDLAFERGKTSNSDKGAGNGLYYCRELVKITNSSLSFLTGDMLYRVDGKSESYFVLPNGYWGGVIIDLQLNIDTINQENVLSLFDGIYPGFIPEYESLDDLFT